MNDETDEGKGATDRKSKGGPSVNTVILVGRLAADPDIRVTRDGAAVAQMILRGLTGAALAKATGLSDTTILNALAGRRLHPVTFRKVAAHLARVELIPGAADLAVGSGGR